MKAYVTADINTKKVQINSILTLKKNQLGRWLVVVAVASATSSAAFSVGRPLVNSANEVRVLITLYEGTGDADMYLTSPWGTHSGIDPRTGLQVEEIKGAFYTVASLDKSKAFRISGMPGLWELKIMGVRDGSYKLYTELMPPGVVGQKNFPIENLTERQTEKGLEEDFLLRVPEAKDKPLEVIFVK